MTEDEFEKFENIDWASLSDEEFCQKHKEVMDLAERSESK